MSMPSAASAATWTRTPPRRGRLGWASRSLPLAITISSSGRFGSSRLTTPSPFSERPFLRSSAARHAEDQPPPRRAHENDDPHPPPPPHRRQQHDNPMSPRTTTLDVDDRLQGSSALVSSLPRTSTRGAELDAEAHSRPSVVHRERHHLLSLRTGRRAAPLGQGRASLHACAISSPAA